jgi:tellurite resistance-related uncharacterized protein
MSPVLRDTRNCKRSFPLIFLVILNLNPRFLFIFFLLLLFYCPGQQYCRRRLVSEIRMSLHCKILILSVILVVVATLLQEVSAFQAPMVSFRRTCRCSPNIQISPAGTIRTNTLRLDAMPEMPCDMVQYSKVPTKDPAFTATTIPKGLLKDHTTKAGTWGVIRVLTGALEYNIQNDDKTGEGESATSFELSPDFVGIIEPERKHHVKALSDNVEFVVEFYREPDTGPVDEPRDGL